MYQVLKRDGSTMEFDISKISAAMIKAFEAQNKKYHPSVSQKSKTVSSLWKTFRTA